MSQIIVVATDTQGKSYIFDKPTLFDPANDPFLFGLERGRKEAARECAEMCLDHNTYVHADVDCQKWPEVIAEAIAAKFGLEI